MSLQSLILLGGLSSRMGVPKHTLPLQNDTTCQQPLLLHLLLCHHHFQLGLGRPRTTIYVSTRDENQKMSVERLLAGCQIPHNLQVSYILDIHIDFGPAAGLLAAHAYDHTHSWLVSGCDYPLLSSSCLDLLHKPHDSQNALITCFINNEGWAEPLLAIWTPLALNLLEKMAAVAQSERRRLGPVSVIRKLQQTPQVYGNIHHGISVNMIKPVDASCLTNVNTFEEWEKIRDHMIDLRSRSEGSRQ